MMLLSCAPAVIQLHVFGTLIGDRYGGALIYAWTEITFLSYIIQKKNHFFSFISLVIVWLYYITGWLYYIT